MDAVKLVNYANRGKAAEQVIEFSNYYYRENGIAVVTYVGSRWVPIRRDGVIVSAKCAQASTVDFVGCWQGKGIAFDVKQNSQPRWSLSQLKPHQHDFLTRWEQADGIAFILIYNVWSDSWHVLRLKDYDELTTSYKSIPQGVIEWWPRCPKMPGCPVDYIGALEGVLK